MQISETTLAAVETYQTNHQYAAAYNAIIADLNSQNLTLTSDEQDVMHWLNTAVAVNSGAFTFDAIAIRAVNQAAVQYETGKSINLFGSEEQAASNAVASAFINQLKNNNGTLPDINTLIGVDAGAGVAILGVSPAGHAAAVPDSLSPIFTGFNNNVYYDGLTSDQQQEANAIHINAIAMMAGYVASASADDTVAQKNAVTSNIASYLASLSQNPVIQGIESAMVSGTGTTFDAVSQLVADIKTGVTDIANNVSLGLSSLQSDLNSLFADSNTSASGSSQILIGPGAGLDIGSNSTDMFFAPVNNQSAFISFNSDGSLAFNFGGVNLLNAPTGTTVSDLNGNFLFQMPGHEGGLLFNTTTASISAFLGNPSLNFLHTVQSTPASWWGLTFSSPKTGSPIILDLNGDGVTTLAASAGAYFDLRNTGFAEQTGWVAPTDGLLVWDRNGNGVIDDGAELFGNYTQTSSGATAANGFAALASYDTNHDGVINASDPIWSNLKIWIDADSNGVTDPGELHSLSSLGITGLSLSYHDNGLGGTDASGNNPEFVSTYTTAAGTGAQIYQI